ncbi:MAG: prepilin peptidase [bacterium]|nr:prepilin peptidase [bacterium]
MNIALVAILGLVVGSFLNAVIYRLHKKVSFLRGRSYCPWCKHDLSAKDLVPLFSYLFLKGKCRYCQKKISWQYPLVEFGTMAVFLLLFWQFGLTLDFFVYLIYASILIIIFVYDLRYYLILDKVSLPAIVIAIILSVFILNISAIDILIGALIGGGFFLLQFYISRGKWIGGGDIRLGVVMGAMLGFPGILVALFAAYVLGSIVGIFLIIGKKKKWKSQVPFGTFLSFATLLTFIFGEFVIEYYSNLFIL